MSLDEVRAEREKWFGWKNIAPLQQKLSEIEQQQCNWSVENGIFKIETDYSEKEFAKSMMPWRKGPFQIGELFIDSEWRSDIKYELLRPHLDIADRKVADVGCNNGYYMFRMLEERPKKIVGFDPSPIFKTQFQFIDRFVDSGIDYEMLGVEHIPLYEEKFDTILCLGVLYHRSDPIATLKQLKSGLEKGGTLILDTFVIDGDGEMCLFPEERYAKMRNIYFIPTVKTLINFCKRAGFKDIEVIDIVPTTVEEQRKTEWIEGESLEHFLNEDNSKTVEGYQPPTRAYLKLIST